MKYPKDIIPWGIFYLSFFVKYTHPTTVAPNIDRIKQGHGYLDFSTKE